MKTIGSLLTACALVAVVGCARQEEPKPVIQEMPPVATPVLVDTMPQADTLKSVEEIKVVTTTKKKVTTVRKTGDGDANGGQVRASRDTKAEGEASGGQVRKSR